MKDDSFKRFDMAATPRKTSWYLKPVKQALCFPAWLTHKPVITYENHVQELQGPFLLLCNLFWTSRSLPDFWEKTMRTMSWQSMDTSAGNG